MLPHASAKFRLARIIALPAIAHSVVAWEMNRPRPRQRRPPSTMTSCCRSNWQQPPTSISTNCKSGTTTIYSSSSSSTIRMGAVRGVPESAAKAVKVGPSGRLAPGVIAPAESEAVAAEVAVEEAEEEEEDWESVVAAVVQRMESTISRT